MPISSEIPSYTYSGPLLFTEHCSTNPHAKSAISRIEDLLTRLTEREDLPLIKHLSMAAEGDNGITLGTRMLDHAKARILLATSFKNDDENSPRGQLLQDWHDKTDKSLDLSVTSYSDKNVLPSFDKRSLKAIAETIELAAVALLNPKYPQPSLEEDFLADLYYFTFQAADWEIGAARPSRFYPYL